MYYGLLYLVIGPGNKHLSCNILLKISELGIGSADNANHDLQR